MSVVKIQLGKNKKEKTLLTVLVMVVIVVFYFHLFLRPAIEKLSTLLPNVSTLRSDLDDARALIEMEPVIEKESEKLQAGFDQYEEIFPSEQEIPKLLESLSNKAGESDVKIIAIKPIANEGFSQNKESKIYQEIPIEIVARSGYHQLGRFLQKLESGDRFITIKDLAIRADPRSITIHRVRLIASTYILRNK